ncbi:GLPGLI family protein [Flavobacterium cyanobacteriorum]|nr:GLPGLI family protein [Flavobacterium cyanobacteriorum]
MKNSTMFAEIICLKNKNFTVYEKIIDFRYSYSEPANLKWEILKETKQIGQYKARQAKCKAYGRQWFAWFTSEIPLNYGPYKFSGLPGLILELHDSQNQFSFSLQDFQKKVIRRKLPNSKDYQQLDKEKFYKRRFRILTADDGSMLFNNADERKKWFDNIFKTNSVLNNKKKNG